MSLALIRILDFDSTASVRRRRKNTGGQRWLAYLTGSVPILRCGLEFRSEAQTEPEVEEVKVWGVGYGSPNIVQNLT